MTSPKILFLYSEVMPYTEAVLRALVARDATIKVVYWDKNRLTPYKPWSDLVEFIPRSTQDERSVFTLLANWNPDIVYLSGRMDALYLRAASRAKAQGIKVVMGSDNQWRGWSLRSVFQSLFGYFLYRRYCTHIWVSGVRQFEFAKRVGFKIDQILFDLYAADVSLFASIDASYDGRDILFIGRLAPEKGIVDLVETVSALSTNGLFDGKLIVFGNGPLRNILPNHPCVEYRGFSKQIDLKDAIRSSAFFCLPSMTEPWGVVLHEMAAAGLPIICSDACGARFAFVKDGYNGKIFKTGDNNALQQAILAMVSLSTDQKRVMGRRSRELAMHITPESSAASLISILK